MASGVAARQRVVAESRGPGVRTNGQVRPLGRPPSSRRAAVPGLSSSRERALIEHARRILSTLAPEEQQVLCLRFGIDAPTGLSIEAIGRRLAVSGTRIRQIEANALRKLRHPTRRARRVSNGEAVRAHSSVWSEPPAHNR
ncbi:MAG TPA: sigma factor-like helix-turn-helix DNA-binding protein [Candidatus Binatia bacterium]|nr:sigma factor-like helix-turn-helix DNA-binding protein [Candidatus Binatia bacterium]